MSKYWGITHSKCLSNKYILILWKKFMCSKNKHLFDEVWSVEDSIDNATHYLYCDACGLSVHISKIERE